MPTSKSSTSNNSLHTVLLQQMVADGDYRALLVELLAHVHRDGGQYTQLAGFAVSVQDAIFQVNELRSINSVLERRIKQLTKEG